MANYFDQFDTGPAQAAPTPPPGGNFFDQFDAPEPAQVAPPSRSDTAALELTVRPPGAEQPPAAPPAPSGAMSVDNVARGLVRGIPVLGGAMDNFAAAADAFTQPVLGRGSSAPSYSERYQQNLGAEQGKDAAFDKENPYLSAVMQVIGGVAGTVPLVAAAPVAMGAKGASIATRALAGGASGAALGGADAAVRSGGDAYEAGIGSVAGGSLGLAAPFVGAAIGKGAQAVADKVGLSRAGAAARGTAPSLAELEAQSQSLYRQARDIGLTVKPEAFKFFVGNLARELRGSGFDAQLHPRARTAVERIANTVGTAPTLDDLEIIRRVVGAAANTIDPDERRVASIIKDRLDDWLDALPQSAVASGDAKAAVGTLREARALWGQKRRGEIIADIMEKAQNQPSGYENGIRIGFRALANNKKAMRGFSEIEQRAIRSVAQGTTLANGLKLLGKAAPTGIVSLALSGGAGAAVGGLPGAVAMLAGGAAARKGSEMLTERAADTAGALARQGRLWQTNTPALPQVNRQAIDEAAQAGLVGLVPAINQ